MGTPYSETAGIYWSAGWRGVLPLPESAKGPVPRGYTGWAGVEPSWPDVLAWIEYGVGRYAAGNIGLRLPRGVYGLDVDDYAGKTGGAALGQLVERLGPLPPTWIVGSRDDSLSGIRLFRAEHGPGRRWRDEPGGHGAGIEAIHYGHRYAVTWPSIHPDTGRKYTLRRPDGTVADGEVPRPDDLPILPAAWAWDLSEAGDVRVGDMAGHDESVGALNGWRTGPPCTLVAQAIARGIVGLERAVDGAALHPAARDALHELINLGHEGHVGVARAVSEHGAVFVEVRKGRAASAHGADSAGAEWWRLVRGAIGKLIPSNRRAECECDRWSGGEGFDFTATAREIALDRLVASADPAPVEFVESVVEGGEPVIDDGSPLALMRRKLVRGSAMGRRPAPQPVVSGLLYRGALSWIIGKSGTFKSFVTLDVGAAVAADKPWAGRKVWGGPVLYVLAEGAGGMPLRVRAWETANGPMPDALIMLPEAVQIMGAGWPVLIEAAREINPVMVIIDTQAQSTLGVKENDNGEMGQMIARLGALRDATGACIWTVHHIGRNGEDARGASALDGAQDTELRVERVGGVKALTARLTVDKQKDGPDTAEIDLVARVIDLGNDPTSGEALSSLVVTPDPFADPMPRAPWEAPDLAPIKVAILRNLGERFGADEGGTAAQVLVLVNEQMGTRPYSKSTFYRAWTELVDRDQVEPTGKGTGRSRYYRLPISGDTASMEQLLGVTK